MSKNKVILFCLLFVLATGYRAESAPRTPTLYEAARSGNLAEVKRHLDKGADVDAKDAEGITPLMRAAEGSNKLEVVKALLDKGADANATNNAGWAPLMWAAYHGNTEVAKALLDGGANVNATNKAGHTPLMMAASEGRIKVIKLLLDKGANLNAKNLHGWTPLTWAVSKGHKEAAEFLKQRGAKEYQQQFGSQSMMQSQAPVATPELTTYAGSYCYGGMPRPAAAVHDPILVLTNSGYLVGYNERRKDPVWVSYRLFKVDRLQPPSGLQKFKVDSRTESKISSDEYIGSGYDRGHCAPHFAISACYGKKAWVETFLMSNILPRRLRLNQGVWENLESTEIRAYAQRFSMIWVTTGPVFGKEAGILKSGVAVPEACYKIIVREENGAPMVMAFLMPQDATGSEPPEKFMTSVKAIEQATGLDLFSDLSKDVQDKLKTSKASAMW